MKIPIPMLVASLFGVGIGVMGVEMLHAQGRQPVYVVYQTELTGDPAVYAKDYVAHIPATLEPFNGHFLVRGGKVIRLEGAAPLPRISIIEFESLEKAQAWYNSPAYQKLIPVRRSVMKTSSFIAQD